MLIAHISDTHIAGWGEKAYGIAPTAENLALCVDHINQLVPGPDLVLVTGDITYSGLLQEARRAASLLDALQFPYYIVPGNHDDRSVLKSVFGKDGCLSGDSRFYNCVIDDFDIRLIGMDSAIAGESGGRICKVRLTWLNERLSEDSKKKTIIFMHHPPVKCGVLETDEDGFIGADELGAVVAEYRNIERILCGHIHLEAHVGWNGTVISTAPSMGMQLVLDLTLRQPSQFILEAPGYQLHYYTPGKNLVSHTIYVRDVDGPYLFEEYPP